MSSSEIVVVLVGLLVGYWIVSAFAGKSKKPPAPDLPADGASVRPEFSPSGTPDGMEWNKVLGVSAQASVEDIRQAYKLLKGQYHPDKVAMLGPEIQAVALRKFTEINLAYRRAMQERGVSEMLW